MDEDTTTITTDRNKKNKPEEPCAERDEDVTSRRIVKISKNTGRHNNTNG